MGGTTHPVSGPAPLEWDPSPVIGGTAHPVCGTSGSHGPALLCVVPESCLWHAVGSVGPSAPIWVGSHTPVGFYGSSVVPIHVQTRNDG